MKASELKQGDKIVLEVADAEVPLGCREAVRIVFKPPSWRREFVGNAGGYIVVNPEDIFDTPNIAVSGGCGADVH